MISLVLPSRVLCQALQGFSVHLERSTVITRMKYPEKYVTIIHREMYEISLGSRDTDSHYKLQITKLSACQHVMEYIAQLSKLAGRPNILFII